LIREESKLSYNILGAPLYIDWWEKRKNSRTDARPQNINASGQAE
jgi:hypothetical protein